jgi:hypothetical protein
MNSRARLLLLVTGSDTVIISRAVSGCAFRAEPGGLQHSGPSVTSAPIADVTEPWGKTARLGVKPGDAGRVGANVQQRHDSRYGSNAARPFVTPSAKTST